MKCKNYGKEQDKNKAQRQTTGQHSETPHKIGNGEVLKALKSELSALDRKIQLELAPPTPVSEEQEKKQETESPVHIVQPPDSRQHIQPFKGLKI